MTNAVVEAIQYKLGAVRPLDHGTVAEVARRHGVPERALQRRVQRAMLILPAALRELRDTE
jgi:hypothetical protein